MSVTKIDTHDGNELLVKSSRNRTVILKKADMQNNFEKWLSQTWHYGVIDTVTNVDRSVIIEFIREFANDPIDFNIDLLVDHLYWEINEREATTLN
jgi:hypothetical protein